MPQLTQRRRTATAHLDETRRPRRAALVAVHARLRHAGGNGIRPDRNPTGPGQRIESPPDDGTGRLQQALVALLRSPAAPCPTTARSCRTRVDLNRVILSNNNFQDCLNTTLSWLVPPRGHARDPERRRQHLLPPRRRERRGEPGPSPARPKKTPGTHKPSGIPSDPSTSSMPSTSGTPSTPSAPAPTPPTASAISRTWARRSPPGRRATRSSRRVSTKAETKADKVAAKIRIRFTVIGDIDATFTGGEKVATILANSTGVAVAPLQAGACARTPACPEAARASGGTLKPCNCELSGMGSVGPSTRCRRLSPDSLPSATSRRRQQPTPTSSLTTDLIQVKAKVGRKGPRADSRAGDCKAFGPVSHSVVTVSREGR